MKRVSIVMAYLNRLEQLKFTLQTISQSAYPNYEVIIVDDGSSSDQDPQQLFNQFPFIRTIKIDSQTKTHINSCIPYNIGFKAVTGELVIIQNPECCHIGDIISYVAENLDDNKYLTFTTANMKEESYNPTLYQKYQQDIDRQLSKFERVRQFISELEKKYKGAVAKNVWYNHGKHRPYYYHFCSAITKANLDKLGGFDERYAYGIGVDDCEIVKRIYHISKLQISVVPFFEPFAIHQWHATSYRGGKKDLFKKNKEIFVEHMKELGLPTSFITTI